jgi:hypothetical protein
MIKLNFTEPVHISPLAIQDTLVIRLHNYSVAQQFFYSDQIGLPLDPHYHLMTSKIRK